MPVARSCFEPGTSTVGIGLRNYSQLVKPTELLRAFDCSLNAEKVPTRFWRPHSDCLAKAASSAKSNSSGMWLRDFTQFRVARDDLNDLFEPFKCSLCFLYCRPLVLNSPLREIDHLHISWIIVGCSFSLPSRLQVCWAVHWSFGRGPFRVLHRNLARECSVSNIGISQTDSISK